MLRVCSLAGETLATFSADEVEDKRVHQLKSSLAKQIGATRFRQRWLAEDHTELQDDAVVPCCDVQLVVLNFVQAEEEELEQLVSACNENRPDEVVDLFRKPLNPDGTHERPAFLESLRLAAGNGYLQIVQLLLEAGTDARQDDHDRTALHLATHNGHLEVVRLLLEAGANTNVSNGLGWTALHWAAEIGHWQILQLLLVAGADKDLTNRFGSTALHAAAANGHSEVVKLLLEAGADKEVADVGGKSPLELAIHCGRAEIVHLLRL